MPGLGRRYAPDIRDRNHSVRRAIETKRLEDVTFRNWWAGGIWGDQGSDCTNLRIRAETSSLTPHRGRKGGCRRRERSSRAVTLPA